MKRLGMAVGGIGCCLILGLGCGREPADPDSVSARNLVTGEIASFKSGEVPDGYTPCTNADCTVPDDVPCDKLGLQVCPLNPSCTLKPLWCSSGTEPAGPDAPQPADDGAADKCEYACVTKGCEDITEAKACMADPTCQWSEAPCLMPCAPDEPSCSCPGSCTTKLPPPPPPPAGCLSSDQCPKGQFCAFPEGCGKLGPGTCVDNHAIDCAMIYAPVCGCDGNTYGNACAATVAGVSIAHKGPCSLPPPPPPSGCLSSDQCPKGQFCAFPEGCGKLGPGSCAMKPEACTMEYAPVCGCDGKTYGNACAAASAGVSVDHKGECSITPPPPPPGCSTNLDCAKNELCLFKSGCGSSDLGQCSLRPQACPEYYAPVCGCDGQTYSNDCFARAAGTSVASQGKCNSTPPGPDPTLCDALRQKYQAAMLEARFCDPNALTFAPQCATKVTTDLACNTCVTFVNNASTLQSIEKLWNAEGCSSLGWMCPMMACQAPLGGNCQAVKMAGTPGLCMDTHK